MVSQYHWEQAAARREQALKEPVAQTPSDELLAELNAELNRRSGRSVTRTVAPAPKPEAPAPEPASRVARRPSWRNALKATLLLLLGLGITIPLVTTGVIWLVIVVGFAGLMVFGVLGVIWKALYDTLQEGDQPPPP